MIVDEVLDAVERELAAHSSEQVGSLRGPLGSPMITAFVPHPRPEELGHGRHQVPVAENAYAGLEIKGLLHVHPAGGLPDDATVDGLQPVTWRGGVSAVVLRQYRRPERHEVLLPSGIMSVYVSAASVGGRAKMHPIRVQVLPIGRDIGRLARCFGAKAAPLCTVDVDGTVFVAADLGLESGDLRLLFAPMYPFQSPTVLARTGSGVTSVPITWDLNVPERLRLELALSVLIGDRAVPWARIDRSVHE
ncbi:hypothetical protein [Nocardia sp.]|uniref:hypothetical protein n=1 Tax=Nocardia sp. TaxID=1821 RepID=UPI00260F58AD|nr:hypothetical protein [Nocardia sp.]